MAVTAWASGQPIAGPQPPRTAFWADPFWNRTTFWSDAA